MVLVDLLTMARPALCQGHFYSSDLLISPSQCQSQLVLQTYELYVQFIPFPVLSYYIAERFQTRQHHINM